MTKKNYHSLEIYRLNVGQGDSGFVKFYHRVDQACSTQFACIVDGGHLHHSQFNPMARHLHRKLHKFLEGEKKKLDLVVITHFDSDHMGGILGLLDRFVFCCNLRDLIDKSQQFFRDYQKKEVLRQPQDVIKLCQTINQFLAMAGRPELIIRHYRLRTRSQTKTYEDMKIKLRETIPQVLKLLVLEEDIKMDENTKFMVPRPIIQDQKFQLTRIEKMLRYLSPNKSQENIIFSQDVSQPSALSSHFPILRSHPFLRIIKNQFGSTEKKNDRSIILLFQHNQFKYLLCGDLTIKPLKSALSSIGSVSLLQVPHHGAKGHLDPDVISSLRPMAAIISCGPNNQHRHPHIDTIKQLKDVQIYMHCKPGVANPSLSNWPENVISVGQNNRVYDYKSRDIQSMCSDIRIKIKNKKKQMKIVFLSGTIGQLFINEHKFGDMSQSRIAACSPIKVTLSKLLDFKGKISIGFAKLPEPDQQGQESVYVQEKDGWTIVRIKDADGALLLEKRGALGKRTRKQLK